MKRSIAIGGFMGVGKTTIGRKLAHTLNVDFCDLDEMVEQRVGDSIADIFARYGESVFRDHEAKTLRQAFDGPPRVVALGGGTLHYGDNHDYIQSHADLFCLSMPLKSIEARLAVHGSERPLWSQAERLYRVRYALYQTAGVCIEVEGMSVQEVVDRIVEEARCA